MNKKEIIEAMGSYAPSLSPALINRIETLVNDSYYKGHKDREDEIEYTEDPEKIGVEYAAEAFAECRDLNDFQDKLREINNRACNFMPTTGI